MSKRVYSRYDLIQSINEMKKKAEGYEEETVDRMITFIKNLYDDEDALEVYQDFLTYINPYLVPDPFPFKSYPKQEELLGPFPLGKVVKHKSLIENDKDFWDKTETCYITPITFQQHMLVMGQPGTGKTTLAYNLIETLYDNGIGIIIIDPKRDYRHLIRHYPEATIMSWSMLKDNPLQSPEGVEQIKWNQCLADCISNAFNITIASKGFLIASLNSLFSAFESNIPTIFDLRDLIASLLIKRGDRDEWYRGVLRNALRTICEVLGPCFDCETGIQPQDLLNERLIIIEIDGLTPDLQTFLAQVLLLKIMNYRISNNLRGLGVENVLIVDEAHRVFSIYTEKKGGPVGHPMIDTLTEEIREFQVGIIALTQEPSKITDSLNACTGTKIVFNIGSGKDIYNVHDTLRLDREQTDYIKSLDIGEAIVRKSDGAWRDPFVLKFPNYNLEKDVADEEAFVNSEVFFSNVIVSPRKPVDSTVIAKAVLIMEEKRGQSIRSGIISDGAKKYLHDIFNDPYLTITERDKKLGVRGDNYRKELEIAGLVQKVKLPERGSPIYLILTDKGREFLGIAEHQPGRGGVEHKFWQEWFFKVFSGRGYVVEVEVNTPHGAVDVLVDKNGKKYAIEIELTLQNALPNLRNNLQEGYQNIIIGVKNVQTEKELKEKITNEFGQIPKNVMVLLLPQIFSYLK